jgi:hypothetical protein
MKAMEQSGLPSQQESWRLEGTYTEQDLRAFAAFLSSRVAGSKLWALAVFMILPLLWAGNIRTTWPLMAPLAVVLIGFILLLRFVLLPNKLYRAALKLPGVFKPRCITIDEGEVCNTSEAGGHTFPLESVREVVAAQDHLFVMVAAKQGLPIPRAWIGDADRTARLREKLLSRAIERV